MIVATSSAFAARCRILIFTDPAADIARTLLADWELPSASTITLLNYSENHTFLVTAPDGARTCLRLHRPGYQSHHTIESELAWLDALGTDAHLPLPRPIPGLDGHLLQSMPTGQGPRHAVLFAYIPGREPTLADDLTPLFVRLGSFAAALHAHVTTWQTPENFSRLTWGAAEILDPDAHWGNWRAAPGVDAEVRRTLDRLDARLRADLDAYGRAPDRFGLIHADMRLGNLLVDGDTVSLIDFDDCGFAWFGYDFAAAISFHETEPQIPDLRAAWLDGYQRHRALNPQDIAMLDTLVLLRRMALLAWIGSHHDTALAKTHRPGFAEDTAMLAERYLDDGRFWIC